MNNPEMPNDTKSADTGHSVHAIARAIKLLEAFQISDSFVTLTELSRRAGIHKTTTLRIARTLADSHYLVQRPEDGAWRLGPAAGWLGARYQASYDVNNAIEPVLLELSQATHESASFFVREGKIRTCLVRVEGPQAIRHHIRVGEVLPLEKGSPGRVLLAFSGQPGEPYENIRRDGFYISIGERDPEIASVSAPVFGNNWKLLGVISVSGPSARLPKTQLKKIAKQICDKAKKLSYVLGGDRSTHKVSITASSWHP